MSTTTTPVESPKIYTTESLTKHLKTSSISPSAKIQFIHQIWNSKNVWMPRWQEFLLEWVCTTMVKSVPKSSSNNSNNPTPSSTPTPTPTTTTTTSNKPSQYVAPYIMVEYWTFLRDALTHFRSALTESNTSSSLQSQQPSVLSATSSFNSTFDMAEILMIRFPILPIFTGLFQHLSKSSDVNDDMKQVWHIARDVYSILHQQPFTEIHRPPFDVRMTLAFEATESLLSFITTSVSSSNELPESEQTTILELYHQILVEFHQSQRGYANARKIFTHLVTKLMIPLGRIRYYLSLQFYSENNNTIIPFTAASTDLKKGIMKTITSILGMGLFHEEFLNDYVNVLYGFSTSTTSTTDSGKKKKKEILSFQRGLFDTLKSAMESNTYPEDIKTSIMDLFPLLLIEFLKARNQFLKKSGNAGVQVIPADSEPNTTTSVSQIKSSIESKFSAEFEMYRQMYLILTHTKSCSLVERIKVLVRLLTILNKWDVCKVVRDEILESILAHFGGLVEWSLGVVESDTQTYPPIMTLWSKLLYLDTTNLDTRLPRICSFAFNPPNALSTTSSLEFTKTLFTISSKTRSLDTLLTRLFTSFLSAEITISNDTLSPIWDTTFLEHWSGLVGQLLPVMQIGLLRVFVDFLTKMSSNNETEQPVSKKRKTTSSKPHTALQEWTTTLLTTFLTQTKPTSATQKQFEALYESMFHDILSSKLTTHWTYIYLHGFLARWSDAYADRFLEIEKVLVVWGDNSDKRISYVLNRIIFEYLDRCISTKHGIPSKTAPIITSIVTKTINEINDQWNVSWDGNIKSLETSNLVANWRLVAEFLGVVCRVCDEKVVDGVLGILIKSFTKGAGNVSTDWNVTKIANTLLQSASFYEIRSIRDRVLFVSLSEFHSRFPIFATPSITALKSSPNYQSFSQSLTTTQHPIHELLPFIAFWNCFPKQYFTTTEQDWLALIAYAVDKSCHDAVIRRWFMSVLEWRLEKLLTLFDPNIVVYLIETCGLNNLLCDSTLRIIDFTIQRLCGAICSDDNRVLPKGSVMLSGLEYLKHIMTLFDSGLDVFRIRVLVVITKRVGEHVHKLDAKTHVEFIGYWKSVIQQRVMNVLELVTNELTRIENLSEQECLKLGLWIEFLDVAVMSLSCSVLFPDGELSQRVLSGLTKLLPVPMNLMIKTTTVPESLVRICKDLITILCRHVSGIRSTTVEALVKMTWKVAEYDMNALSALELFMKRCSMDEYFGLADYVVRVLGGSDLSLGYSDSEPGNQRVMVIVQTAKLVVESLTDGRRYGIKKYLAVVLAGLLKVLGGTRSKSVLVLVLEICLVVTADPQLTLKPRELSLILTHLILLLRPERRDLFHLHPDDPTPALLTRHDAHKIFNKTYYILTNILKFHRESLKDLLHLFFPILSSLTHAFRALPSVHALMTTARQQQKKRDVEDKTDTITHRSNKTDKYGPLIHLPAPLLSSFAPLDPTAQENFARLLTAITIRPTTGNDRGKSSNYIKPFTKHIPFLLVNLMNIQVSARPFQNKDVLIESGVYCLLDVCSEYELKYVLANLEMNSGAKSLFKKVVVEWETGHKFKGKV